MRAAVGEMQERCGAGHLGASLRVFVRELLTDVGAQPATRQRLRVAACVRLVLDGAVPLEFAGELRLKGVEGPVRAFFVT